MNKNIHTIIAVAVVLAAGTIFYPALTALAQMDNATDGGNTTNTMNTTANETNTASLNNTFTARGSIAGLIFDFGETTPASSTDNSTMTSSNTTSANLTSTLGNTTNPVDNATSTASNEIDAMASNETTTAESQLPYIVAGDWDMGVADGNVTSFNVGFTMVHTDGTGRHTHELSNFQADNGTAVQLDGNGSGTISGTADVSLNGTERWTNVTTTVMIERNNAIAISLDSEATDNHFQGQPIYGVVDSWLDVNGQELISDARAAVATAGETVSDAGENLTKSAEQIGNQTGNVVENITNTTGNVLEDLGDSVADLFNGTGDQ